MPKVKSQNQTDLVVATVLTLTVLSSGLYFLGLVSTVTSLF